MSDDLKKLKEREAKIHELEKNVKQLLSEVHFELPGTYKISLLHPIEYLFLQFLREELIHGKITNLAISQGLPRWAEYCLEDGVVKRVKFDQEKDVL